MAVVNPLILYDNRFEDAAPTAADFGMGTEAGYNVDNLTDLRMYTFWKAAAAGTQYITVHLGSSKSANCLAIAGHNLHTAGAKISLECSSDKFSVGDITVVVPEFSTKCWS